MFVEINILWILQLSFAASYQVFSLFANMVLIMIGECSEKNRIRYSVELRTQRITVRDNYFIKYSMASRVNHLKAMEWSNISL